MCRLTNITLLALCLLSFSCTRVGLRAIAPEYPPEVIFKSDLNKVWTALHQYFKKEGIRLEHSSREKGVIVTAWHFGKSRRYYYNFMEQKLFHDAQFSYMVTLSKHVKGTRVNIITKEQINLIIDNDEDQEWELTDPDTMRSYEILYRTGVMLGENLPEKFRQADIPSKPPWLSHKRYKHLSPKKFSW